MTISRPVQRLTPFALLLASGCAAVPNLGPAPVVEPGPMVNPPPPVEPGSTAPPPPTPPVDPRPAPPAPPSPPVENLTPGKVPDAIGLWREAAEGLVRRAGYRYQIVLKPTHDLEDGRVLGQQPAPGEALAAGEVVTLDGGEWLHGAGEFNTLLEQPEDFWQELRKRRD